MEKQRGFTLLELLVGMVIISIGISISIPSYLRNMRQGEIDRYTQQLESGFFSLRAKLGQQKTSCTLIFDSSGLNNFVSPAGLVEVRKHPERIECCNSDIEAAGQSNGCAYGPEIGELLAKNSSGPEKERIIRDRSLRMVNQERTPESMATKISVNLPSYELTPPGTSTMTEELIFLIKSNKPDDQNLRTRCLEISGTGRIYRGTWNEVSTRCEEKQFSQ